MKQYEQRSIEELCAPGHARHMMMIKQDQWLHDTLLQADQRKKADEDRLEAEVQTFRETGRWPKRPALKVPGKRANR